MIKLGEIVELQTLGDSRGDLVIAEAQKHIPFEIQRSYFKEYTVIGDDVKVGPGANPGHGCEIDSAAVLTSNSVLAGYCHVGKNVWIGSNSTVAHVVRIGDNARVHLGSVVVKNVAPETEVSGNFAVTHRINARNSTKSHLENKK